MNREELNKLIIDTIKESVTENTTELRQLAADLSVKLEDAHARRLEIMQDLHKKINLSAGELSDDNKEYITNKIKEYTLPWIMDVEKGRIAELKKAGLLDLIPISRLKKSTRIKKR